MSEPRLIEEIFFEDDISGISLSHDGTFVAISVPGLVGVYTVDFEKGRQRFTHITSYIIPGIASVKTSYFSLNNSVLTIITDDGFRRELSVFERTNGFMTVRSCIAMELEAKAA